MTIEAAPFAKNVVTTQIIYRDQWLTDRVFQLEKELLDTQNKLSSVELLVEGLKRGLDRIPEGAESRLTLLEEKNRLLEYKNTIQSISIKLYVSIEAAPFAENVVNTQIIYRDRWLTDRVLQLETDFLGIQNKFGSVEPLVERLERGLDQALDKMPEGAESRLALLEEKNLLLEYKDALRAISVKSQASIEASNWLNTNRTFLVSYARDNLFQRNGTLKMFDGLRINKETIHMFCDDLDFYLLWIAQHLHMGTTPKEVPRGTISLVLPSELYIIAFKLIDNDKISANIGLSEKAFKLLKSYVNRFLIKRSLEIDASTKT